VLNVSHYTNSELDVYQSDQQREIQKLLQEISKLHDTIYQIEQSNKGDLEFLNQECEQAALANQSLTTQIYILEL
jgi:ABC-type phosphate transport system auxiliary subunit